MFEKFGELGSFKEINELAENLLKEGDIESLKAMAEENGIQKDYVEMYLKGDIPVLCDALTAAMGKIDVEAAGQNIGESCPGEEIAPAQKSAEIKVHKDKECDADKTIDTRKGTDAEAEAGSEGEDKPQKTSEKDAEKQIPGQMELTKDFPEYCPPEVVETQVIRDILASGDVRKIVRLLKSEFKEPELGWEEWLRKVVEVDV